MSEVSETSYSNKVAILGEFWIDLRDDYPELIKYGDLGFPLAYAIAEGVIESTPQAEEYINEIWGMLVRTLRVKDTGFSDLMELLESPQFDYQDE